MSKYLISVKNIYIFYILYLIILPMGILNRIFFSRTLTLKEFGIVYGLIAFYGFLSFFVNIGFSASLKYYIPKFLVKKKYVKIKNMFYYSFSIQLLLVLLFSVIVYFFSDWITNNYFHNPEIEPLLLIFILYFIGINLLIAVEDIFISYKLNIYYQTIKFTQLLLIFLTAFYFYYFGYSNLVLYYSLAWGFVTMFLFVIYIIILFIKFPYLRSMPVKDKKLFKTQMKYSYFMFFSGLGFLVLGQTDIIMITYFLSIENVALYSNAYNIIVMLTSFFALFSIICMPLFSELIEKKKISVLNSILKVFYNLIIYFLLPFLLTLLLFSEQILVLLYGPDYAAGTIVLSIFSFFAIFLIFNAYNLSFINGMGLVKKIPIIVFSIAVLNIFLNFFLIIQFGINGAAISTGLSWFLMFILTSRVVFKKLNFSIELKYIFKLILISILFLLILYVLKENVRFWGYYVSSFAVISLSFISYFVIGYFLNIYKINDLYVLMPEFIKPKIEKLHKKYFPFLK